MMIISDLEPTESIYTVVNIALFLLLYDDYFEITLYPKIRVLRQLSIQ